MSVAKYRCARLDAIKPTVDDFVLLGRSSTGIRIVVFRDLQEYMYGHSMTHSLWALVMGGVSKHGHIEVLDTKVWPVIWRVSIMERTFFLCTT